MAFPFILFMAFKTKLVHFYYIYVFYAILALL